MPDHKYLETPSMVDQRHALLGYICSFKLVENKWTQISVHNAGANHQQSRYMGAIWPGTK
jgi:hypothetical protein